MMTKAKAKSRVFTVHRMCAGQSWGEYGTPCYDRQIGGLDPQGIVGASLWNGAKIRVTVEILSPGRKKRNPGWPRKKANRKP